MTATASSGVATFANLSHNVAGTVSLGFTSGSLTSAVSSSVQVNPAAADRLVFTTQPGSATVGAIFGVQPVVVSQDAFGNNSTVGLGAGRNVNMTLSSGVGTLLGTTILGIGTDAGNGTVAFSNLRIDYGGSGKQLTASASGLTSATSSSFSVNTANQTITFGSLTNQTYGASPLTLSATASSGLPVVQRAFRSGNGFR